MRRIVMALGMLLMIASAGVRTIAVACGHGGGGGSASCDPATLTAADVSGNEQVTSLDALMIIQAAAGGIAL